MCGRNWPNVANVAECRKVCNMTPARQECLVVLNPMTEELFKYWPVTSSLATLFKKTGEFDIFCRYDSLPSPFSVPFVSLMKTIVSQGYELPTTKIFSHVSSLFKEEITLAPIMSMMIIGLLCMTYTWSNVNYNALSTTATRGWWGLVNSNQYK